MNAVNFNEYAMEQNKAKIKKDEARQNTSWNHYISNSIVANSDKNIKPLMRKSLNLTT